MATAKEWNIDNKRAAVVTDNAPSIVSAIRINNWKHVPCFAHVLNIGIQHGLEQLKTVMTKIKNIVEYFKQFWGSI